LLRRTATDKAEAVKQKRNPEPKPLRQSDVDHVPFSLPTGWHWIQAQDACEPSGTITYGILKPVWVVEGVPTVRVQDMKGGRIVVEGVGHCSLERAERFSKTTLRAGDLLIAKDGATLGKTAFVPPELDGGNVTQHVLRFPISRHFCKFFVRLVVDSAHGQAWMLNSSFHEDLHSLRNVA
jgi:type I restriction enzyme S subunit